MSKDGRNCMLNSSPMSKTGLTVADQSDNLDLVNRTFLTDPQDCTIGKRVYVGGIRPGVIAFIGETHFAPGDWAGIVLDDPSGKNDGSVGGKRYFQCESKHGIFSRTNRLTLTPQSDRKGSTSEYNNDADRGRAVSPSPSMESGYLRSPANMRREPVVGDRVIVSSGLGSRLGELKFLGETKFAAGTWCGIQLDEPNGKNDGSVDGFKYFDCPAKYGIFVPIAKVSLSPSAKKGQLSRMGSRESLTSVGTMNSVATTNTSRLRMSMLKKPYTPGMYTSQIKNTPKPSFSMQDIIREKQNYIEQLMNERELDREDVQNQNMLRQKIIDEMKEKISVLEIKLAKLENTNEELRNSIDEATFCTEEVNAQNQVQREKAILLEKKLLELDPNVKMDFNKLIEVEKIECLRCTEYAKDKVQLKEKVVNLEAKESQNSKFRTEDVNKFKEAVSQIEELKKTVVQLESDKEFLENEFKKLKEESLEIQQIVTTKDIETNKFASILASLESTNVQLQSKNSELTDININLQSEIQKLTSQLTKLKAEMTETASNMEGEKIEFDKLTADKICKYEKQLDEQNLKNIENDRQMTELQYQNEKLESEMKEILAKSTNIQNIKDKETLEILEKINILENQNRELNEKFNDENKKNQILNSQIDKYKNDLEGQTVELNSIVEQKTSKISELTELQGILKTTQDEILLKNIKLEELRQSNAELDKTNQDIKNEIEKIASNFKNVSTQYENLKQQLSTTVENKEDYVKKFTELQINNSNILNESAKKDIQLEEYKIQLANSGKQLLEMQQSKLDVEKLLERTGTELNEMKESKEKLSEEYSKKIETLQEQATALIYQISELSKSKEIAEIETQSLATKLNMQEVELNSVCNSKELETKKYNELSNLHESLNKKYLDQISQLNLSSNEIKTLQEKLIHHTNENHSLQDSLDKITKDLDQSKILYDVQTHEYEKLEINVAKLQNENNELQKSTENLTENNMKLNSEITRVTTQLNNLELELSSALNSQESENNELNQLVAAHKIVKEDVAQKNIQLDDKNNKISELEKTIVEIKSEKEELNNFLKIAQNDLKTLQKLQNDDNQQYVMNCKSLESKNSELEKNLTEIEKHNKKLLLEVQQITGQTLKLESTLATTLAAQSTEIHDFNNLKEAHKYAIESAAEKDAQLIEKIQIISEQHLQIIQSKDIKEELTKELIVLKEQLVINQKSIDEHKIKADTSKQEYDELNSKLLESFETNKNLNAEINELKQAKADLEKLLSEYQAKTHSIHNDLTTTETLIQDKDSKLQSLTKLSNEMKLKYTELATKNQELAEEIEKITKTAQNLQGKIGESETAKENKQSELLAIENKYESQNEILNKLQTSYNSIQEILVKTETELSEKDIRNSELEKLVSELNDKHKILVSNADKIRHELTEAQCLALEDANQLKAREETLKMENDANATVIKSLQSSIEKLTNTLNDQNEETKRISQKMEELQSENSDLKQKYSSTNELLKETQIDFEKLQFEYQDTLNASQNLARKYKELDIEKSELIKADKAISEITHELDLLQNENEQLSEENDKLKKTVIILESEKKDAENNAEMSQIESEQLMESMKNNYVHLRSQSDQYLQEIHQKNTENKQGKNLVKVANEELDIKKEIISQLEHEINRLRLTGTTVRIPQSMDGGDKSDTAGQINFLNSIIADMHKKNECLKSRINDLEAPYSNDFLQSNSLQELTKRKPAPRLFCDICDEFDAHDTEDCPSQASDSPPVSVSSRRDIKDIAPRKYCESCEVFGHEVGDCPNDECF